MWVRLGISGNGTNLFEVEDFKAASRAVRKYIEENDLGAGCSEESYAFAGGEVYSDDMKVIAKVSYNGRVWEPTKMAAGVEQPQKEIVL